MGNKQAAFTEDQLEDYQDCTYFNRNDILRIHQRYRDLNTDLIPEDFTELDVQPKLKYKLLQQLPELKENPFRRRICEVFSPDGDGSLTFDDFLNMMSVLSESAPRELKARYAFKIFDFDQDDYLGKEDLKQTLRAITANELTDEEMEFVSDKLLEEADLDENGYLSYAEFENVIARSPEFMNNFHIHI